jgi:hypothetical protein
MAVLIETVGERHGVAYTVPAQEVARGAGAIMRGLMLDWILAVADDDRTRVFEETVAAFLRGVAVPLDERSAR